MTQPSTTQRRGPGLRLEPSPLGPRTPRRRGRRLDLLPYALVTPLALFIICLAFVPAAYTLGLAFFKVRQLEPPTRFNGLNNFINLAGDPAVRASIVNTLIYSVIGVTLATVLGIYFAITLQHKFRGRPVVIAAMILPWALPGVVEGIVWSGIYDPNSGLVNSILYSLNLTNHYHVLIGQNHLLTLLLIELVQVWQMTPLSTLLILAALQNIPGELYEASHLDGCSRWQAIRRITLPLARPGIAVAMVQAVIATLNVFDQPYVLNGAADVGASVTQQTYYVSFQNLDFGEGYALSLAITVVTLVASFVVLKAVYRTVEF